MISVILEYIIENINGHFFMVDQWCHIVNNMVRIVIIKKLYH